MKKLLYLLAISTIITSCKKEQKKYVTFSGKITNKNSDSVVITNAHNTQYQLRKLIKVDKNGTFKDTLNAKKGFYWLFDGKKYIHLYLNQGFNFNLTFDTQKLDQTINYTGFIGAKENSILTKFGRDKNNLFGNKELLNLPKLDFETKISSFVKEYNKKTNETSLDSTFVISQKQSILEFEKAITKIYNNNQYIVNHLTKGIISPKFVSYENNAGGTTSLDDLKGKYVYIDLWATWCKPCENEIPFLKKVEKRYHNKTIEFVSISIDRQRNYETWKKMIVDKKLTGVQLYAKEDKTFMNAYRVTGIPRFILIDPEGNIVDANAPKPSNPKLIELFESLNI